MRIQDIEEKKKQKLMLLGSGSVGKSTLFKQLNWLHASKDNNNNIDPISQLKNIRENIIDGIATLLQKSAQLYEKDSKKYAKCFVNIEDLPSDIVENIKLFVSIKDQFGDYSDEDIYSLNLGKKVLPIWKLDFVQETHKWRRHFHIADNIEYFFEKAEEIFKKDYTPSREDILKARIRTTGLVSSLLRVEENGHFNEFEIWDAGGQRSERSKWIHQFDGVTGLIFVAALNHYCQVLFEDEKKNAMHENLKVFEDTVNNKYFMNTEVMLFLNKDDLFRKKLKKGINLDVAFTNHPDWPETNEQWDPKNNYDPKSNDEEKFKKAHFESTQYFERIYKAKQKNQKFLYCHITCALDQNNVQKVFWDTQNIIIRANMKKFGFAP